VPVDRRNMPSEAVRPDRTRAKLWRECWNPQIGALTEPPDKNRHGQEPLECRRLFGDSHIQNEWDSQRLALLKSSESNTSSVQDIEDVVSTTASFISRQIGRIISLGERAYVPILYTIGE